jgi:hypothetical protein
MALPEIFMINAGMQGLSFLPCGIATFIFFHKKLKKVKSICRIAGLYYFCSPVSALELLLLIPQGGNAARVRS